MVAFAGTAETHETVTGAGHVITGGAVVTDTGSVHVPELQPPLVVVSDKVKLPLQLVSATALTVWTAEVVTPPGKVAFPLIVQE